MGRMFLGMPVSGHCSRRQTLFNCFLLMLVVLYLLVALLHIFIVASKHDVFSQKGLCHLQIPMVAEPRIDYPTPSSIQPPLNAAILYLAEFDNPARIGDLEYSLERLYLYFLSHTTRYPVYIFYEPRHRVFLTAYLRSRLQAAVHHVMLSDQSYFNSTNVLQFHEAVDFDSLPSYVAWNSVPDTVDGFTLGYRFMCRFWAYGVFQQGVVSSLRYYWRLDTDLYLHRRISIDPFSWMEASSIGYVYGAVDLDEDQVLFGLWKTTLEHARRLKIHPYGLVPLANPAQVSAVTPLHEAVDRLKVAGYNRFIYYNNFELSRVDLWRSQQYLDYFMDLDHTGGIFRYRWGDAPIRTLALSLLGGIFQEMVSNTTSRPFLVQWKDLCYFHARLQAT